MHTIISILTLLHVCTYAYYTELHIHTYVIKHWGHITHADHNLDSLIERASSAFRAASAMAPRVNTELFLGAELSKYCP
mgnify:CR=1 FL=1